VEVAAALPGLGRRAPGERPPGEAVGLDQQVPRGAGDRSPQRRQQQSHDDEHLAHDRGGERERDDSRHHERDAADDGAPHQRTSRVGQHPRLEVARGRPDGAVAQIRHEGELYEDAAAVGT